MPKLTKREYVKTKAILERELAIVNAELAALDAAYDEGEFIMGDEIEHWNFLHDSQSEWTEALRGLEHDWSTRNWTAADWQSYALVQSNID